MDDQKIYSFVLNKSNWMVHVLYWLIAAFLLFFIFSNRGYDPAIRFVFVSFIIVISFIVSYFINNYLIPNYLFAGRFWIFTYIIVLVFLSMLWLIFYALILTVIYNAYNLPDITVPTKEDIIIMVTGSYLIIVFAAVVHFVKESYKRIIEKNDIIKQKQLTEIKLKEAKLKLLQGQMHPHFLFNMLNNLYGLIKESADVSRDVIVKLSGLLDYMLYECDKPIVSLKREIGFIQNYIELERIRHDENFNLTTSFPSCKDEILIAPLILFPFIENAFKHGFNDPLRSFVDIKMEIKGFELRFEIKNPINRNINDKYLSQEGRGIGLKNIKERLELIYKNRYMLEMNEVENNYCVKLILELSNDAENQL